MNAKLLSLGLTAILATPIIVVSNAQQAQALCKGSSCKKLGCASEKRGKGSKGVPTPGL